MPSKRRRRSRVAQPSRKKIVLLVASVLFVGGLLLFPLVFLAMMGESTAAVTAVEKADSYAAVRAKRLAQQLRHDLVSDASEAAITVSQEDVNGIIAIAMRGAKRLQGRVNVTPQGIEGAFAIHMPQNPMGRYLNIRFGIDPSFYGLHLNYLRVGSLHFSGDSALDIGEFLLNIVAGGGLGSLLRHAIKSIEVVGSSATIVYQPIPDLKQRLAFFRHKLKGVRDELELVANAEAVSTYYHQLCRFGDEVKEAKKLSLGYYMAEAYSLAAIRTQLGGDPVAENRAALMALAIYLGSTRFESFVGEVVTEELAYCRDIGRRQAQLANRSDLRLHFIYSAALKVISDSGMSFAIGEFKEMMDSGRGGSGFSFVDLAADRTGIRFAETAMDSRGGALRLQKMALKLVDESAFFPKVSDLPEGISQQLFESRYGGIEGPLYREYVRDIVSRFNQVPLYNPWL